MQNFYKSKRITFVPGSTEQVPLDFLPTRGKRGGRILVERLMLHFSVPVTTPVGVTVASEDIATLIKECRIYDAEGDRRKLTGAEIRFKQFLDSGSFARPTEDAVTIPAGGQTTAARTLCIYFTQPWKAHRAKDYAMPVDDLLNGGGIDVAMASVSDVESTGGDITSIDAGGYLEVWAVCREAHDMEYYARDVVKAFGFSAGTEFYVPISNKLLRELTVYENVDTFAAKTKTEIDTVSIEPFGFNNIPRTLFEENYLLEGITDVDADPVKAKLLPLVYPGRDGKIPEMNLIGGQLLVQFTGSSTSYAPKFIVHTIAPKSRSMAQTAAAANGIGAVNTEVRTKGKGSARDASRFGNYARFMAAKQKGALNK